MIDLDNWAERIPQRLAQIRGQPQTGWSAEPNSVDSNGAFCERGRFLPGNTMV